MNKTFKVIFNKARGSFMVVNELTSAIQKKGTRTDSSEYLEVKALLFGT